MQEAETSKAKTETTRAYLIRTTYPILIKRTNLLFQKRKGKINTSSARICFKGEPDGFIEILSAHIDDSKTDQDFIFAPPEGGEDRIRGSRPYSA